MSSPLAVVLGVVTGLFAGMFGIGGGVVIIPVLVLLFHYSQHQATGISLTALLLPVGVLGVWEYYRSGFLGTAELRLGLWIALGIFIGTYGGAHLSVQLPARTLQKVFAVFLVVVALDLWFDPARR